MGVQGEGTNTPWMSSGAEGGSGYTWVGTGFLPERRGSQGFCDSDFRSRDQTRPGHSLLFLVLVPVLVVEDVLLLLVIGYLDGWCQAFGKFL